MASERADEHAVAGVVERGGRWWRLGSAETVRWIDEGSTIDLTITSAMAPVFNAYATLSDSDDDTYPHLLPGLGDLLVPFGRDFAGEDVEDGAWLSEEWAEARESAYLWQWESRLVQVLTSFGSATWWLGYLDTGADYLPFPDAPRVQMGPGWEYVVVEAGLYQARSWRLQLPELIFPADHCWCVHKLWDDSWSCVGGPEPLINELADDDLIETRRVQLGEDATPPGHLAT